MDANLPDDIMYSQTLEREYDCRKAGPLDLRDCVFKHAFFPEFLCVYPKAFPSRGPSGSACSLLSFTPKSHTQNVFKWGSAAKYQFGNETRLQSLSRIIYKVPILTLK